MIWTISAASEAIQSGRLTPLELVDTCLERIEQFESKVRAWVFVDREGARKSAKRATTEIREGRWRGPLHGIPLGIKDIIDVANWPTAAGFRPWSDNIAQGDATVVERLRQAGAVFLGKTVTTQFASFDPPVTRNPWNPQRTPGGSSSGSAAAVACGMCLGALASQTGGSITRPASYCGVAGCKPTVGRVSNDGVVPLAPSMDHVGAMAGCVDDLAIILQIIAGADERDPQCSTRAVPDLTSQANGSQKPPRIGRLPGLFHDLAEPCVRPLMDDVIGRFRLENGTVQDAVLPASFADILPVHRTIMAVEAAAFHKSRLESQGQHYGPRIRELIEEGLACSASKYQACKKYQLDLRSELVSCFEGLDVLLTPATTGPAPDAATTGDPAFNSPWSLVGFPTVSMPAGFSPEGLPLAIQLVSLPWQEAELFAAAVWCERALGLDRREPLI
jgi:aspartyl-tRNA(Asn)/glutamyl-tRNA(Gln) amidotransferase subunit A